MIRPKAIVLGREVCSDETVVGEDAVVSTSSELLEQGLADAAL